MLNTSNAVRIPSKTPTTRVAFLILAHHEPKLLHRLLERLSADWAHCFVHVDRKADIKQFQDEVPRKNVTFLPMSQRVSVHWCGYSASSAILNLMRYAMTSAHQPSRFVLLSGVDYPIRSMDHIGQAISEDKEFIHIDREIDSTGDSSFDRCLNRRFLGDSKLFNPRTAPGCSRSIGPKIGKVVSKTSPPRAAGILWANMVDTHQGSGTRGIGIC
jgi:hypothetical protein